MRKRDDFRVKDVKDAKNTEVNGRKQFNFIYIGIGLVFLIDFNVNSIDFLPDLIAVFFISAGIGKIYYADENFAAVKFYLRIFTALAAVKIALNIAYFIFMRNEIINSNITLILAFVFSVFELFLSVNIFKKIFRGIDGFFDISGSLSHSKSFRIMSSSVNIFFFVKFILTFFSQIPALLSESNLDGLSMMFNMNLDAGSLNNMLITPCFIIQTLLGLFVLSLAIPFFSEISKDKNLYDFIKSKINYVLINDIFFVLKQNLNAAFSLFIAGCVFFIDMEFDNINILPDFMICVCFIAGISIIKKTNPEIKNKKLDIFLILNLFVSAAAYITGTIYKIKAFYSLPEDMNSLQPLRLVWNLLYHSSVILFFLIFIEFYYFIKNLQRKHLEFSVTYLGKYITSSEKNFYKNRNLIFIAASIIFSLKTLSVLLPPVGVVLFFHALLLIIFTVYIAAGLNKTKEDIYSYYAK